MKKWSFFIINILVANVILACNFGTSHPILWHYNQTDEVFIGKVIKIGNVETMDFAYVEKSTNIPTYKVRLVVQKTYKSLLKDTIDIGKIALAKIDFKLGESYLIYGDYLENNGFLATGNILNVTDARMKKHGLLDKIANNPTQLITEYHPISKKIWAIGQLKNARATGEWQYFEITGELKEKGSYKKGKRHGKWLEYFVTDVGFFNKMVAIKSNTSRRYKFIKEEKIIAIESNYQYRLTYFDKSKNGENSIDYLYKKPVIRRIIHFKKGQLHGKRLVYNYEQEILEYKTYKFGLLHGESQVITQSNINEIAHKKVVEVVFKNGEIVKETIFYYENEQLVKTENP